MNEIIFLHQMSLMPHRYEVQRERERESWQSLTGAGHALTPNTFSAQQGLGRSVPAKYPPSPRFHHHAASFGQARFARLMSL